MLCSTAWSKHKLSWDSGANMWEGKQHWDQDGGDEEIAQEPRPKVQLDSEQKYKVR